MRLSVIHVYTIVHHFVRHLAPPSPSQMYWQTYRSASAELSMTHYDYYYLLNTPEWHSILNTQKCTKIPCSIAILKSVSLAVT